MCQYVYIWEFQVQPEHRVEFERCYGPGGEWVLLFGRAEGYLGTLLLHDHADPLRYVTVDRWQSPAAYKAFRERFSREYGDLDHKCEGFTKREASLGEFSTDA